MPAPHAVARHTIFLPWLLAACCALLLSACASSTQKTALERLQYSYSAAIRWGDFEGAWNLVDPEYREAHPMTEVEFERYKHIQVSSYRDMAAEVGPATAARQVEIGVINRHNMAERSLRYVEAWRYDAEAGTWWIVGGLPDFWAGE